MSIKVRLSWRNLETDLLGECVSTLPVTIGREGDNDITLDHKQVSRLHASLREEFEMVVLHDETSRNGTFINAEGVEQVVLAEGDLFQIGPFLFTLEAILMPNQPAAVSHDPNQTIAMPLSAATLVFDDQEDQLASLATVQQAKSQHEGEGQFPPSWFEQETVPIDLVKAAAFPMDETTYLAVGGGLGSFAWIDGLRVSGVPASEIIAVGFDPIPYGR